MRACECCDIDDSQIIFNMIIHFFFSIRIYFIRISRLKFTKF